MNIGQLVGNILPFDPTPGFQLSRSTAGVPFIAHSSSTTNPSPGTTTQPSGHVLGATTNTPNTLSAQSSPYTEADAQAAADARDRAAALFGIDTGINQANDALGRLDGQAQAGYGNIARDYQDAYNRLMTGKTRAQDDYQRGTVDQTNSYLAARNNNNQQASNWLTGAQRTLGAQGAGGGSAARYALPFQAQTQAAQANSGAQATNNHNIGALTSNWNRAQDEFTNSEHDLERQRDQGTNDYRSNIENQRATLLSQLASLQGQRTLANGGDFRAAQAAAAPYTSRIQSILDTIDGLSSTPAIHEQQVTVGRPDLSGYNFAHPEAAPVAQQDPTLTANNVNPILALFGLDNQDQQQQQFV